jgi:hypothetical protein
VLDYGTAAKRMDNGTQSRMPGRRLQISVFLAVCLVGCCLFLSRIHEGFSPWDDPMLAHTAERTLKGETPQIDFHDGYTGGLSYLNALGMRAFGVRLLSIRIVLFIFFVPWMAVIWYLATRFTTTAGAAVVTLLCIIWSVPIYPSPLGSWYSLYFATFGVGSLFRYIETGHRRWIFLAGFLTGLSLLAKVTALYFLAGAIVFLIFDEQLDKPTSSEGALSSGRALSLFLTLVPVFCLFFALWHLLRSRIDVNSIYHFVLPSLAISAVLILQAVRTAGRSLRDRLRGFGKRFVLLFSGFSVPIGLYLIPYIRAHALHSWIQNVFELSIARLTHFALAPTHPLLAFATVPLIILIWLDGDEQSPGKRLTLFLTISVLLGALLASSLRHPVVSKWIWLSVATTTPIIVLVGAMMLATGSVTSLKAQKQFFLLLAVTAEFTLVQFPTSGFLWFLHTAPLLILSCAMLSAVRTNKLAYRPRTSLSLLLPACFFYGAFAVLVVFPCQIYQNGVWVDARQTKAFTLPRGDGMVTDSSVVDLYELAIPEVIKHSGNAPIWAGPDATEFYFLSSRTNPTPVLYESSAGRDGEPQRLLFWIDKARVQVVVINHRPKTPSGPIAPEFESALRVRFPLSKTIGWWEIRWKE